MSITAEAALTQLANLQQSGPVSLTQLQALVSQVSVNTPGVASGATKIFFSGSIGDLPGYEAVNAIVAASGGSTESFGSNNQLSMFIRSPQFQSALNTA